MNVLRVLSRLSSGARASRLLTGAAFLMPTWFTVACLLAPGNLHANGFVQPRDKQGDVNEPTQKVIILYDQGREDLVLQARYEGPAQEFGWLIPVPGLPEVKQGSMNCFYDLSRLTREPLWPEEFNPVSLVSSSSRTGPVKAVEIKTIGAFEVTVLSTQDTNSLAEWLVAHDFVLPKEKQSLLDGYIKNRWYFVAARVNPNEKGFVLKSGPPRKAPLPPSASQGAVGGELHPLIISFPSGKCVYPLALSAAGAEPSEVSVMVLSGEPLMSRAVFEKKFVAYRREQAEWIKQRPAREKNWYASTNHAEEIKFESSMRQSRRRNVQNDDPADPVPPPEITVPLRATAGPLGDFSESDEDFWRGGVLVRSMEARPEDLPACAKELPRLAGKSWWLTKQVERFAPEELCDLEFEPAVPMFAEKLHTPEGRTLAHELPQFGTHAVPIVLAGLSSSEPAERRLAASAMARMADPRLVAPLAGLLEDADARIRATACKAARGNWDGTFVPRLVQLLSDQEAEVRWAACDCLQAHPAESTNNISAYQKLVENGGVAALPAMTLLNRHHAQLPKASWVHLLSSTDPGMITAAMENLRFQQKLELDEISRLLTNSLPMARRWGLILLRPNDKAAIDRIVSMLRDPNEGLRWLARDNLRRISGKKLGADPAAWEKWWAENRETFKPASSAQPPLEKQ
jgi:HEAT repeat protein